jgi:hypothetical protein
MSNFENFNTAMRAFLYDLAEVFPENNAIESSLESFDDLVKVNYKKPQQMFISAFAPFAEHVAQRDASMFAHLKFPGFDFNELWNSDISENTKQAIWVYVQQLMIIASQC